MADNKEMHLEYDLFADIWKFYKNYYNPSDDKNYWNELINAGHEIEAKYNNKLCNDLLVSIISELERKHYQIKDNSS